MSGGIRVKRETGREEEQKWREKGEAALMLCRGRCVAGLYNVITPMSLS